MNKINNTCPHGVDSAIAGILCDDCSGEPCPHGETGIMAKVCLKCRPASPEMMRLAEIAVERMESNTAENEGDPCPCGRGLAVERAGTRFECSFCFEDGVAAAVDFVCDTSFGGQ